MDDQHKFLDPEEMVSCPYEIAHSCPRKRLAFHLTKCRKQHLELAKELRQCIHNVQHRIPRPEYEYHLETCPDRENYYQSQYQVGETENEALPALLENLRIPINIHTDENWDEEPVVNVLENVRREAQSKNVLENFCNEPPAVRKALREESRRKHRDKQNQEERRQEERNRLKGTNNSRSHHSKRNGSSSSSKWDDDDDSSSVGSARSAVSSCETNISYRTALTSNISRMDEFQTVERKKKIGRGSGQVSSFTPNVQHGIGRGKKHGDDRSYDTYSSRRSSRVARPYSTFHPYR